MSSLNLPEGAGSFLFRDEGAVPSPRTMRVFFYRPRSSDRHTRIVMAMHGVDRAAAAFRDLLAPQAERNGQIVLVPEFDPDQFPGVHAYNFGGVRRPPPDNAVLPRCFITSGIRSGRAGRRSACSATQRARNLCCAISR